MLLVNLERAYVVILAAACRNIAVKVLLRKKFPDFLKKEGKKAAVTPQVPQTAVRGMWQRTLCGMDAVVVVVTVAARVEIVATAVMLTVAVE
jgi:hypothetical protein